MFPKLRRNLQRITKKKKKKKRNKTRYTVAHVEYACQYEGHELEQ